LTKLLNNQTVRNHSEIVHAIQAIETMCDSASQSLAHRFGHQDKDVKKVIIALKKTRKIQSRYFPIIERSIKRYYDSIDSSGNYKPHLSKSNYPKYKRGQDIKKGLQGVLLPIHDTWG